MRTTVAVRAGLILVVGLAGAMGAPAAASSEGERPELVVSSPLTVHRETDDPKWSNDFFGTPSLVIDRFGTATVAWRERGRVLTARRVGGSWGAPEPLPCGGYCIGARLAVDRDGTVSAVWEDEGDGTPEIRVSQRPRFGSWEPPVTLTRGRVFPAGSMPDVVAGWRGAALVTFTVYGRRGFGEAAFYRSAGRSWEEATGTYFAAAQEGKAAMSGDGHALLVVRAPQLDQHLRAYRFVPGTGWGDPRPVGIGWGFERDVAMGPGGRAVVAWQRPLDDPGSPTRWATQVRMMSWDGIWRRTRTISDARPDPGQPLAVMDLTGRASVVWLQGDKILEASKTPFGDWEAVTASARPGALRTLDGNRAGTLALTWEQWNHGPDTFVAVRSSGGLWSEPEYVATGWESDTSGEVVEVAADPATGPDGSVLLTYVDEDTDGRLLFSRAYNLPGDLAAMP